MDPGSIIGLLSLLLSGGSALSSLFSGGNQQGQSSLFGGTPESIKQIPRFNPQQEQVLNQLLSQGLGGLKGLQQGFNFAPIAQQARTRFQTETLPSIAERFTAMGGGQRSSAFPAALGAAATGLESNLAAQQAHYGFENQGRQQNLLMSLLNAGLQPRSEQLLIPRSPGLFEAGLPSLLQGAGAGVAKYGLTRAFGG